MIKLAVCGDSWFTCDTAYPAQSFSELISSKNNWELLSLARAGCSNFTICLQVNHAIQVNADVVIVGVTTPDRIEVPIVPTDADSPWSRMRKLFTWENWFHNAPRAFDKTRGLANIRYTDKDLSGLHDFLVDPTVVSESMNNLVFSQDWGGLTKEQFDSLKLYMLYLYDNGVKQQMDIWMINAACDRLIRAGIPFLLCVEAFGDDVKDFDWLPQDNIMYPHDLQFGALPRDDEARFHYCANQGAPIFADYVESRINQLLNKGNI